MANIKIKEIGITYSHLSCDPLIDEQKYIMAGYENLTNDDEQYKYIYALVGKALFWAQCFELQLQISIPMIEKTGKCKILTPNEYDEFQQVLSKRTMGQLVKELKKKITVEHNAEILLEDAIEKRNYLAHFFFKEHSYDFGNSEKRKGMVSELVKIESLFRQADDLVKLVSNLFFKTIGINKKDLDSFTEQATSILTTHTGKEADELFNSLVQKIFKGKLR